MVFLMPPINSTLNYNRPRDMAIGRRLAAGQHQPTIPKVQTTLDASMPAHAARATALAVAELYPSDIPVRKQTTLDATMPAHAARAAELAVKRSDAYS